jgi:hypothetical protein
MAPVMSEFYLGSVIFVRVEMSAACLGGEMTGWLMIPQQDIQHPVTVACKNEGTPSR